MPTPTEARKEALILAFLIGGMTAIIMTTMVFISDFLGFHQVKEGQNCPQGTTCHYLGWIGLAGLALTGYGIGLGWAVYRVYLRNYYRKNPKLLLPAYRREEPDA